MENKKDLQPKTLFKITPNDLRKYGQRSVFFTKPRLVAYYECNYDEVTPGKRVPYFIKPTPTQYPFDLNDGFETYISRLSSMYKRHIELCLKYAMTPVAENDTPNKDSVERAVIYTRRGTLSHIMQSNYVKKYNSWSIKVTRYNGNIYMVQEELDESKMELKKVNTHHDRLEKILFAESPNVSPQTDDQCNENIRLDGVHRSTFGKYDIVYSGEIQGIIAEEKFEDFDDMEAFNKCRFVLTKQMWESLKYDDFKFLNYWLQAYLANVNDLYVGYKNKNGVIEEPIEHKIVSDIPKNRYWKPNICTAFLHDFLERVEKLMSRVNCLHTVYVFHYNTTEKSISYDIHTGETEKSFLTQEYIEYCKKNFQ